MSASDDEKKTLTRTGRPSDTHPVALGPTGSASRPRTAAYGGVAAAALASGASADTDELEMAVHKPYVPKTVKKGRVKAFTPALRVLASISEDTDMAASVVGDASTASELAPLSKAVTRTVEARARGGAAAAARRIASMQRVYLCFLLDTTGSMARCMSLVKDQIHAIVASITEQGCLIDGVAFVGYKDWCDGPDHFEVLDFTTRLDDFKSFVARTTADGGGDFPEDVLGGMHVALKRLSWPGPADGRSKIILHCADAPPHGRKYHSSGGDSFPEGHTEDPDVGRLFEEYKRLGIDYLFLRLDSACDQMLAAFEPHLGHPVEVFSLSTGFSPAELTATVAKSVTETVLKKTSTVSSTVAERPRPYTIKDTPVAFAALPPIKVIMTEMALPSLADIISGTGLDVKASLVWAKVARHPFAKGAVRLAYWAQLLFPPEESSLSATTVPTAAWTVDEHVFKERINLPGKSVFDELRYLTDLEVQTVASALAFEFNAVMLDAEIPVPFKIKYLEVSLVTFPEEARPAGPGDVGRLEKGGKLLPRWMSIEKKFRGAVDMVKFTNNGKYVMKAPTPEQIAADPSLADMADKIALAVAFSHFTHVVTSGYLMVTDLQGINTVDTKAAKTLLLTDPAIHCTDPLRFGTTNFGAGGMDAFFERHVCNCFCAAAGLPPSKPAVGAK